MLGLFERIGEGLEMAGIAIEGAFLEAECAVKNAAIDIKTDAKVRKYQRARLETGDTLEDDEEDIEEFEEEMLSEEQVQTYEKMFTEIVQHGDFCTRKPSEIGVELGYSEEEVTECFKYMQDTIKGAGKGVAKNPTNTIVRRRQKESLFDVFKRPHRFMHDENNEDDKQ